MQLRSGCGRNKVALHFKSACIVRRSSSPASEAVIRVLKSMPPIHPDIKILGRFSFEKRRLIFWNGTLSSGLALAYGITFCHGSVAEQTDRLDGKLI